MKSRTKPIIIVSLVLVVIMSLSFTVFAAVAWDNFNAVLPKNQGATEVSTVARSNSSTSYKHFTVKIKSISSGYTSVCVWAKKPGGTNYSKSSQQVGINVTPNVGYDEVPAAGKNVILNLKNPVKTTATPRVSGTWTPN